MSQNTRNTRPDSPRTAMLHRLSDRTRRIARQLELANEDPSCCATWARSMSAGASSRSAAARCARSCAYPGGPPSKLDPNGRIMVEQMYVQYLLPKNRKGKYPLLMWHGGGLTGVTYESTPDGREGWLNLFVRKGWDVYVSDAVERGRAGFASPDVWRASRFSSLTADPYERFRIGDGARLLESRSRQTQSAARQPVPGRGLRQLHAAGVPRWSVDRQGDHRRLYRRWSTRSVRACMLLHSQGGSFGFQGRASSGPDKVKAHRGGGVGRAPASSRNAPALKETPVLMMFGDYVDQHPRWSDLQEDRPGIRGGDASAGRRHASM